MLVLDTTGNSININTNNYSGISIGKDGKITAVDNTNTLKTIATIGLAKFSNPGGLTRVGGNNFKVSSSSGQPQPVVGGNIPGTNGTGVVQSGALEMSNVDLSEEFTEMIVAQRGFQANSRIITTSDQILEELVNLKR
jgi:flagellar hook protein FlgE